MHLLSRLPYKADDLPRRGAFMIVALLTLIIVFAFVAFTVDLGLISMHRSKMQGSVDSAALAAAMEISHAVESAPATAADVVAYAKDEAAAKAAEVAGMNGYYVDPNSDVVFGSRTFDEATEKYTIDWSIPYSQPANVVKVIARKENSDLSAPDGKLRLFFAQLIGADNASLRVEAAAFVESRDIVVVHDFSRSMNFDSQFSDETSNTPSDYVVLDNMRAMWDDLQPLSMGTLGFDPQYLVVSQTNPNISVRFRYSQADVTSSTAYSQVKLRFTNGNTQTFATSGTAGTFTGSGSNSGRDIASVYVTVTTSTPGTAATVNFSGSPSGSAAFAADRKSVQLSASQNWDRVQLQFTDGSSQTIRGVGNSGTFEGTGSYSGRELAEVRIRKDSGNSWQPWIDSPSGGSSETTQEYTFLDNDASVLASFGLNGVGYPFPSGSWSDYVSFVRSQSKLYEKGYREMYGGLTFVQYILRNKSSHYQTPAIGWARHYPFHAIKLGHGLLCDFLQDLGFNDYVGMVSYDTYHRVETQQNEPGVPTVDISNDPLGTNYDAVKNLMQYKQANHYYPATNIGGGLRDAIGLLQDKGRSGSRPNIVLMTDGNANVSDGSTIVPSNVQGQLDGFDGPGSTYQIGSNAAMRSLWCEVASAVDKGYTIHTIAVGSDADWQTMKAIAYYSKGEFIWVPGGQSTADMEAGLMSAFHRIAGMVPPAKLMPAE
ncbi:MAG: pilus assembly protein TadG-related protein [Planctomycetaceae bacterium]